MHICIHFVSVPWQTWSLSRTHGIPLPLSDRVTPPPYVCLDTLYVRIWKLPSHCQNSFLCLIYICRKVLYVLMLTWQYIALKRQLNVKEALFRSPLNIKSLKPLADIDTLQITHWPKGALFRSWEGCIDHFCFFFIARGNYLVVTLSAWMAYSLKVSLEPLQPPPKRPPYSEACAGLPYLPHWRGPWDWSMSCSKRL